MDYLRLARTRFRPRLLTCLAVIGCGLLSVQCWAGQAHAAEAGVLRATLDNGLRVVIVRNTLAPVVSTSVNYLVGSDEAPEGFPGMAHAQEHMMFRGSPGLSADQLADIGSVMGGNFNADTRESVTQYLFTVPSEDIDVALRIEAARMRGVTDSDADWRQERGAIEQEVAQDLSNPGYVLFSKLRESMFAGTVYAHDALGTRPSFEATTAAMLRKFHDTWYAPNAAVLVIVGDVDPQATLDKVRLFFGPIPKKQQPPHPVLALQPVAEQNIRLDTDLPYGTQVAAFRMPGLDSPDYAASEILSDVLSSHRADLYALVPQGKAVSAGFSIDPLPMAGLGYAMVAFPVGVDAKEIERDLRAILKKFVDQGVPPEFVAAAKLRERREAEFERNSIEGLAAVWSEAVAVDGLQSPDDDLARIEKVTVDDVNRVARKYLDFDHATFALLTPRSAGRPVASSGFGGQENISLGEAAATRLPDWAETALHHLSVPASTVHPIVSTLANGITLIVQPEDVSDTVSLYGHIRNRSELEVPNGQEGLSQVLEGMFPFGTEKLDRLSYQQALDEIGAEEDAGTDFSLEVLAENFDRGVALLAENELRPALSPDAFAAVQKRVAGLVAGRIRSPAYLTQKSLRKALYPHDDPMLRETLPGTVQALTVDNIRDYYRNTFRPDLTAIVVIGKIDPERAKAVVEKYFGGWQATGPKPETELKPVGPNQATAEAVPDESRVQDQVILSETIGLTRSDPDYYALNLGNNVLGGSFYSTRLSRDLRKTAGLVYSVGSIIDAQKTRGNYYIDYACDPQNVSKASGIVVRELRDMQAAPVPRDELDRVKALLLRKIPLGEASTKAIANGLTQRWSLDLPLDEPQFAARRYLELGPGDVQTAFRKWIRPDDLARVTEGPLPN